MPTIAIVANYDSFSIAPTLASGLDNGASQAAVIASVAKIFGKLYNSENGKPNKNVIFLLAGGSYMNYEGVRLWSESLKTPIEYAICVESVGSDNELNFHLSRIQKNNTAAHIFDAILSSSKLNKQGENIHTKKINLMNPQLAWPHEQLAIKHIPGVTISRQSNPVLPLENRGSVSDNKANVANIANTVSTIVDGLGKVLYGIDPNKYQLSKASEFAPDNTFIENVLSAFSKYPHTAPYIDSDNVLIQAINRTLVHSGLETVITESEPSDKSKTYFGPKESSELIVYLSKPVSFDIIFIGAVAVYFIVLFLSFNV